MNNYKIFFYTHIYVCVYVFVGMCTCLHRADEGVTLQELELHAVLSCLSCVLETQPLSSAVAVGVPQC